MGSALFPEIWVGSHKDQDAKAAVTIVPDTVLFARSSQDYLAAKQAKFTLADQETALPFEDVVDLIGFIVGVWFLFLARFQAVNITEEIRRFEEVDLLHFFSRKPRFFSRVPDGFHTAWLSKD